MPTTNVNIASGTAYIKIADDTDTLVLSSCASEGLPIEYVTTAVDSAPSADLEGHVLDHRVEAMTRIAIGTGFLWARSQMGPVVLVLTLDS